AGAPGRTALDAGPPARRLDGPLETDRASATARSRDSGVENCDSRVENRVMEPIGDRRRLERLAGGGYAYELIDEPLRIEFRYLRRDHGQLHAEVDVRCQWAGVATHKASLSCADMNISSLPTRKTLAK